MKCDEVRPMLEAYVDGEMEALRAVEVERHLEGCAGCRGRKEQMVSLRSGVRAGATYHKAPAALRARIAAMVEEKGGGGAARQARFVFPWRAVAIAACLMLLVSLGWPLFARTREGLKDTLATEVLSAHLRSLQVGHLEDVASSDMHTVRPWFAGKLDFAPPVNDLKAQGFALLGGRLEYLGGRAVAALVYQRKNHVINVFLWPATGADVSPQEKTLRGYHLLRAVRDGMEFYLVSDMEEGGLVELEQLLPTKP